MLLHMKYITLGEEYRYFKPTATLFINFPNTNGVLGDYKLEGCHLPSLRYIEIFNRNNRSAFESDIYSPDIRIPRTRLRIAGEF